ncbi:MAG: hypothetical protein D6714_17965 [Bacteroidetes bacterium]|nr:MAG: hypothetical protein D6714_17965 [Bacteroidota bacterium]
MPIFLYVFQSIFASETRFSNVFECAFSKASAKIELFIKNKNQKLFFRPFFSTLLPTPSRTPFSDKTKRHNYLIFNILKPIHPAIRLTALHT